jgi:hypothetical protein
MTQQTSSLNKMLGNIVDGLENPLKADEFRPSDVVGDSIAKRAQAISTLNKRAGKRIGAVADKLADQQVNIKAPIDKFFNDLSQAGVTFTRGDDGWVTPDFTRSKFKGGNREQLTVLFNDLLKEKQGF